MGSDLLISAGLFLQQRFSTLGAHTLSQKVTMKPKLRIPEKALRFSDQPNVCEYPQPQVKPRKCCRHHASPGPFLTWRPMPCQARATFTVEFCSASLQSKTSMGGVRGHRCWNYGGKGCYCSPWLDVVSIIHRGYSLVQWFSAPPHCTNCSNTYIRRTQVEFPKGPAPPSEIC